MLVATIPTSPPRQALPARPPPSTVVARRILVSIPDALSPCAPPYARVPSIAVRIESRPTSLLDGLRCFRPRCLPRQRARRHARSTSQSPPPSQDNERAQKSREPCRWITTRREALQRSWKRNSWKKKVGTRKRWTRKQWILSGTRNRICSGPCAGVIQHLPLRYLKFPFAILLRLYGRFRSHHSRALDTPFP